MELYEVNVNNICSYVIKHSTTKAQAIYAIKAMQFSDSKQEDDGKCNYNNPHCQQYKYWPWMHNQTLDRWNIVFNLQIGRMNSYFSKLL